MTHLTYCGPEGAESPHYGGLVRGRVYQEADDTFAAYLVATHPDHWQLADTQSQPGPVADEQE